VIAGNRGTDLLGQALETWVGHLADSENNSKPLAGRDGLGWGTPMSPEFRQVIKSCAFGFTCGMRQTKMLLVHPRHAMSLTPEDTREAAERYFQRFPEAQAYTGKTPRVRACADCRFLRPISGGIRTRCQTCGREL
jgi:hypothetical protein